MSEESFNSYTKMIDDILQRIYVDFSKPTSQEDVAGMYADVWGTDYKEEIVNSVVQYCNTCQAWEHVEFTTEKSRCLKCNTIRGSY